MPLDTDLQAHLAGHAGLSALIAARLYPEGDEPENPVKPYVTYVRTEGEKGQVFGAGNAVAATDADYEYWIVSATKASGRAVRAQLRAALLMFTGTAPRVGAVTLRDGREQYDWDVTAHFTPVEATFAAEGDA